MRRRRRRRGELGCREVGRLLQRYLDGEIDELGARQVTRHLDECRRCGMSAETYVEIRRSLRRSAGPYPAEALARLRAFGRELAEGWEPHRAEEPGA